MIIKQHHLDRVYAEACRQFSAPEMDLKATLFLWDFMNDLDGCSDNKTGGAWLRSQVDDGREYPFDIMARADIMDSVYHLRWTSGWVLAGRSAF